MKPGKAGGGAMHVRLLCERCGAALAPAFSGPRCPRFSACGRGGLIETSMARSFMPRSGTPSNAKA